MPSEMRSRPLRAFDAVVRDTPASRATSVSVAGRAISTGQAYFPGRSSVRRGWIQRDGLPMSLRPSPPGAGRSRGSSALPGRTLRKRFPNQRAGSLNLY